MLHERVLAKVVAVVLLAAFPWGTVLGGTDSPTGTISGHVLSSESRSPLAGVQVHVGNPRTGEVRTSAPTAVDGSFKVAGLLPASYEIAVQSAKSVYVANGSVLLAPGQTRSVQVAVNQDPQMAPSPAEQHKHDKRGAGWWNNPLAATLIVVGAAVLIGVTVDQLTNDSNDAAPPSQSAPSR